MDWKSTGNGPESTPSWTGREMVSRRTRKHFGAHFFLPPGCGPFDTTVGPRSSWMPKERRTTGHVRPVMDGAFSKTGKKWTLTERMKAARWRSAMDCKGH